MPSLQQSKLQPQSLAEAAAEGGFGGAELVGSQIEAFQVGEPARSGDGAAAGFADVVHV